MKTLLCEQAGRGSLRYLLFEDAEGGLRRYSVLIEQRECDRSELLRDVADSLPEALGARRRIPARRPDAAGQFRRAHRRLSCRRARTGAERPPSACPRDI